MQNIIPASAGAARAVGKVIPELIKRLNGMSKRVPVLDVSVVDLNVRTTKSTPLDEIKSVMCEESKNMHNILGVTEEEVVSSDFMRDSRSRAFDANASMVLGSNFFKLIAWHGSEFGCVTRIILLLDSISKKKKNELNIPIYSALIY